MFAMSDASNVWTCPLRSRDGTFSDVPLCASMVIYAVASALCSSSHGFTAGFGSPATRTFISRFVGIYRTNNALEKGHWAVTSRTYEMRRVERKRHGDQGRGFAGSGEASSCCTRRSSHLRPAERGLGFHAQQSAITVRQDPNDAFGVAGVRWCSSQAHREMESVAYELSPEPGGYHLASHEHDEASCWKPHRRPCVMHERPVLPAIGTLRVRFERATQPGKLVLSVRVTSGLRSSVSSRRRMGVRFLALPGDTSFLHVYDATYAILPPVHQGCSRAITWSLVGPHAIPGSYDNLCILLRYAWMAKGALFAHMPGNLTRGMWGQRTDIPEGARSPACSDMNCPRISARL